MSAGDTLQCAQNYGVELLWSASVWGGMNSLMVLLLSLLCLTASASAEAPAPPVWAASQVEGDPLFFVKDDAGKPARAMLLFIPEKPPVVQSATRETTYEAGRDYTWQPGSREVRLAAGSRIPFKTAADLHPAPESPHSYKACRDGKSWMLFGEGRYFHDLQCVAAYPALNDWKGPQPKPAPEEQLANVRAKCKAGQPVKLVTLGDSISTGANASGAVGAPPLQPGYPDLVARGLEARFGIKVTSKNLSVGGMDSAWGLKQVPAVVAEAPDLVLCAFGMNDASGRRSPADFSVITSQIVQQIHAARPQCNVILVTPMTANPDWTFSAPELYPAYAAVLEKLAGPACAAANVTDVWTAIMEKKPYLCLTGNGLNHPNDFGHRLYAEVILAVVGGGNTK